MGFISRIIWRKEGAREREVERVRDKGREADAEAGRDVKYTWLYIYMYAIIHGFILFDLFHTGPRGLKKWGSEERWIYHTYVLRSAMYL